jgi:transposase InsO family protein
MAQKRVHERWAHLRFSVIGQLLAAPPQKGALKAEIEALAAKDWRHPVTGALVRFGASTIERWFYAARRERHDPVAALRRKRRQDAGQTLAMSPALRQALFAQYAAHKSWSAQLHHDNLEALAKDNPALAPVPSYATVRRFLRQNDLIKRSRVSSRDTAGVRQAEARLEAREVRSFEAEHVGSLWHWDFHHGSRKVLTPQGEWRTPLLLGILDDRSRLACHLQWYLAETSENVAHGLSQAIQKRGLPRAAMSDNGAAMTAAEISEGLARLGVLHQTTLPYSPYQNAKQEVFWGPVEGRLMAMLEDVPDLSLTLLNEATQAWAEYEYNRKLHSEIKKRRPSSASSPGPRWPAPVPTAPPSSSRSPAPRPGSCAGAMGPSRFWAAGSRSPAAIATCPRWRSATLSGTSPWCTWWTPSPAPCCAGSFPRTRPGTPAVCAGLWSRFPAKRWPSSLPAAWPRC